MKILFVCLGNICRSPLAEAIMKHKLNEAGLSEKIRVDSCGTAGYHIGERPDHRTIRNAASNGVKINHVGRQLTASDLEKHDIILAMDKSNYENILRLKNASQFSDKLKLMRDFDDDPGDEVPDPYYGEERDFQQVFDILDKSVDGFIAHLRKSSLL